MILSFLYFIGYCIMAGITAGCGLRLCAKSNQISREGVIFGAVFWPIGLPIIIACWITWLIAGD